MARNMFDGIGVFVNLNTPKIRYAFKSRVEDEKNRAALGQTDITDKVKAVDASKGAIVVSPSFPKPRRASKKFKTGYTGSFCSDDKVAELKKDGWSITKGKQRFASSSPLTETFFVTINGVKYAWLINTPSSGSLPTALNTGGVTKSNLGASDIIWAADFPKPPRMKIVTDEGIFSTFYDPSKEADLAKLDNVSFSKSGYLHSVDQLLDMFGVVKGATTTK